MRSASDTLAAHSATAAIVGDRRQTDTVAGLEAGTHAVPVLSGLTERAVADRFPYRPSRIVDPVAELVDEVG